MLRLCLVFSTFFSQKCILFPHGFFPALDIGYLPALVPRDEVAVAPRPRRIGQELWQAPLQDMRGVKRWGATKDRQQLLSLHSGRSTWNIIIGVWKIIFLSKWVICMFHVNLPGCKSPRFFWARKVLFVEFLDDFVWSLVLFFCSFFAACFDICRHFRTFWGTLCVRPFFFDVSRYQQTKLKFESGRCNSDCIVWWISMPTSLPELRGVIADCICNMF